MIRLPLDYDLIQSLLGKGLTRKDIYTQIYPTNPPLAYKTFCQALNERGLGRVSNKTWDPDELQRVLLRYSQGASFTIIAGEFGVTRGVIAGIITRSGIKRASKPVITLRKPAWGRNLPRRRRNEPPPSLPVEVKKLSVFELTPTTCRWPYGDPLSGDFFFCGLDCSDVYCPAHARMAYRDPDYRRRDKGYANFTRW